MTTVALLTSNAAHDDLTPDDYRQIYDELRQSRSLRKFVDLIDSRYSDSWWSKYEAGDLRLSRAARNELRRAVSLPELPPAVAELLADPAVVSPDASVYSVAPTSTASTRVILVESAVTDITLHINSDISLLDPALHSPATAVAGPTRRSKRKSVHLSPDPWQRLNAARLDTGYTWDQFIDQLLSLWDTPL